jgi:phosphoribosylformylglycinamidine cyclo-ligase
VLGPERIGAGDVLIALGSSGLHSNGYSLVRHVLLGPASGLTLDSTPDLLAGRTLGEELLTPTTVYALDCLALASEAGAQAFAHITGGGLAGNLIRVIPAGLDAVVDRATWTPQPVFELIRQVGAVAREQLELTFNLGVGMIAVVPRQRADEALAVAASRGLRAWRIGEIREGTGKVEMTGDYAGTAGEWR